MKQRIWFISLCLILVMTLAGCRSYSKEPSLKFVSYDASRVVLTDIETGRREVCVESGKGGFPEFILPHLTNEEDAFYGELDWIPIYTDENAEEHLQLLNTHSKKTINLTKLFQRTKDGSCQIYEWRILSDRTSERPVKEYLYVTLKNNHSNQEPEGYLIDFEELTEATRFEDFTSVNLDCNTLAKRYYGYIRGWADEDIPFYESTFQPWDDQTLQVDLLQRNVKVIEDEFILLDSMRMAQLNDNHTILSFEPILPNRTAVFGAVSPDDPFVIFISTERSHYNDMDVHQIDLNTKEVTHITSFKEQRNPLENYVGIIKW
ncbi:hypothetical protein [Dolosicoccus paucivorans]